MPSPKFILLPAMAALALSLSACNPKADTTSSKSSPGADPMRSAQGPGAPGSPGRSDPAASPTAPGGPGDVMSKEEKERNREASPAPSGDTK